MRKVFILVVFLVSVGEISGQWLSGYSYRKLITINDTAVSGSVDLQDYPFLYSTTDTVLRSVFHGGLVFSDNGWDIRFTGDDGITLLDHEVEMFTASTGELIALIRIPVLSYSEDTELYMYFGNQGIQSDPSTSNAWSTDFRGVWHLNGNAERI